MFVDPAVDLVGPHKAGRVDSDGQAGHGQCGLGIELPCEA
jgi:hypothetical protein